MVEPDLTSSLARQISATIQEALSVQDELASVRERAQRPHSCLVLIDHLTTIVDRLIQNLFEALQGRHMAASQLPVLRRLLRKGVAPYLDIINRILDSRLSWGQVYPLELLCRKISRESRLLIYADPREGYAYWDAMADLRDLKRFLSDSPASTEFSCSEDPRFLAIFSIPSAESDVVLQDAAWSHEIGHHIDTVFHVSEAICESPLFDPQRVSVGGSSHEPVGSAAQHVETHQGYREKNATYESWFGLLKNWVRELVADLFAVHVFGPASVFALSQVAPAPTVTNRVSDTHPPTWLRVGAMLDELDYLGYDLVFRAESLDPQAEEVRAAVADRIKELRHILPRAPGQYEPCSSLVPVLENIIHALPTIAERVRQTSRDGWRCHAGDVARDVYALVARLACGLPPCEVDVAGHIVGRETSVAAIVNAGWFYRIWRDLDAAPVDVSQAHQQHVQLRRLGLLVLKAIELSAIKSQLGQLDQATPEASVRLGGLLTRPDIEAYLARPWPQKKLVVTPLTDAQRQIGSNGIDLKLGCELLVPRSGRTTYLSIQPEEATRAALEAAHERVHLRIGEEFILHEHQFVMATTLEYVQLPPTLAGYVMGRSSWERVGLHVRPARIPPGYTGCIQLQLVSHKDVPIELITGARICQMLLFPVSSPLPDERSDEVVAHPTFSAIVDDDELTALRRGRPHVAVGIVSTLMAGEVDVADYLHEQHGFGRLSLATQVYEETRRRGLAATIPNLQDVGNSLREAYGPAVLVERLRSAIQWQIQEANLVITAIKNPAEVQALQRLLPDFRLLALDGPQNLRYARACIGDQLGVQASQETFALVDSRDRGVGEPAWGQQVEACMRMADGPVDVISASNVREQFDRLYRSIL